MSSYEPDKPTEYPMNRNQRLFQLKDVLMQVEIYALTYERHAFQPQAQPLLSGRTPSQFDLTACAEYTLPGKLAWDHFFQKARDGSVIAAVSCGASHLAVACDLSTWDGTNRFCKCFVSDFGGGAHSGVIGNRQAWGTQ
jgi:hypothetical protein